MRLSPALLALVLASAAGAQPGPTAYADRAGGLESDAASGVVADEDGHIVMVGTIDGTATFGAISVTVDETGCVFSTCHDGFVAKYAPDGTALWVRRMGTSADNDFAEGIALAGEPYSSDRDILVSGTFTGVATWDGGTNPDAELTARGGSDAFLARYTASGDLLWVIQGGGAQQDTGRGVATDFEGSAYWTGSFYGSATFGEGDDAVTLTSDGSSDGFVVRIEPDGTLGWVRQVGSQEGADVYDAAFSDAGENGGALIAGSFSGVATIGSEAMQSSGGSDIYVASLDAGDGSVTWVQQIGGSGDDHARGIAVNAYYEPILVAGWFSGEVLVGADVLASAGETDILLAALDPDGTPLWGRRGGGSGSDIATDVYAFPPLYIATLSGDRPTTAPTFVTGYIDGTATFEDARGTTITLAGQGRDGFLAAYALDPFFGESGDLRAALALGGPSQDAGFGVNATSSYQNPPPRDASTIGFYAVVAGTFRETATLFGETVQSAGSSDAFLAKTATCPGLFCLPTAAEPSPEASGVRLSIAPHPTAGASTLTVTLASPGALRVEVYDARGRRVATLADGPHASGAHALALPPLAPGTYLVRAVTPEGVVSRPVVVAR